MRTIELPGGETVPTLGLGTWFMGESASQFVREVGAVRYALERGIRLIDTAEMYANGGAEDVVGAALAGFDAVPRDDVFIVSKVLPNHAHFDLLHWRGAAPFQETLDAFETLRGSGKIRYFGVSNFDAADMDEWCACNGGSALATNQILYNLSRRGVEWDVLPECEKRGVPVMAYSPLEQGRLKGVPVLSQIAARYGVAPLQVALAWVLAQDNIIAIPKSVSHAHIDQNIEALDITLDAEDHAALDAAFPPPSGPSHLEML